MLCAVATCIDKVLLDVIMALTMAGVAELSDSAITLEASSGCCVT